MIANAYEFLLRKSKDINMEEDTQDNIRRIEIPVSDPEIDINRKDSQDDLIENDNIKSEQSLLKKKTKRPDNEDIDELNKHKAGKDEGDSDNEDIK